MNRYRNIAIAFAVAVVLCIWATIASAATTTATFQWDANTEADLAGYKLWQGAAATGPWTLKSTLGKVTTTSLPGIVDGTHYFTLTAHDTNNNQSGYSNVVTFTTDTTPPGAPKNVVITITVQVP